MAQTEPAASHLRPSAVRPDYVYENEATVGLQGRTITLWYNDTLHQWHAELTGGQQGDVVHLDYIDPEEQIAGEPYHVAKATVPLRGSMVNTSDHADTFGRACGFVNGAKACTGWIGIYY